MIEVRYAGVVVGRTAIVRDLDTRGLFLGITEPLPVGTPVVLHIAERAGGENVTGKVTAVSESQELAQAGMRVRFDDPQVAALFGTPVEAPPESEPPRLPPQAAAAPAPAPAPAPVPVAIVSQPPLDAAVPAQPSNPRHIVVDASTERSPESAVPEAGGEEGGDTGAIGGESGRIPAPDPTAFGGGGGRRGRRSRRR